MTRPRAKIHPANRRNAAGTSKLFDAIDQDDIDIVEDMLASGANVHARTERPNLLLGRLYKVGYAIGSTPMHAAALVGTPDIIDALVHYGADINAKNNEGYSPLDYALMAHTYEEKKLERMRAGALKLKSSLAAAEEKVALRAAIVRQILEAGGKPAYVALCTKFSDKAAPAAAPVVAEKKRKPPAPGVSN